MTQLRAVLPQPPEDYDPAFERRRNRRIEELLNAKLERTSAPVFGGIPLGVLYGSDTAKSVSASTQTLMPFSLVNVGSVDLIDQATDEFNLLNEMTCFIGVSLFNNSAGLAGKTNLLTVEIYETGGGSPLVTFNTAQPFFQNAYISVMGHLTIAEPKGPLECYVTHDGAGAMSVDMTKSSWFIAQLTVDPRLVESERGI